MKLLSREHGQTGTKDEEGYNVIILWSAQSTWRNPSVCGGQFIPKNIPARKEERSYAYLLQVQGTSCPINSRFKIPLTPTTSQSMYVQTYDKLCLVLSLCQAHEQGTFPKQGAILSKNQLVLSPYFGNVGPTLGF